MRPNEEPSSDGPRPASAAFDPAAASAQIRLLEEAVSRILRGKPEVVRLAVVCLLAQGHVLIEDVPGVGKTTLAVALARTLGLGFHRIQFTSDLLPSDIIGVSIYQRQAERFQFVPGPIFSNVVLADEINRASPKTQSALLEAMSERHISVDRLRHPLPQPFMVLATQNPLEYVGTFPLPESQLDRFLMSLRIGYPPRADERDLLLSGGVAGALADLEPILDREQLLALQAQPPRVRVAEKLVDYMLAIAETTRSSGEFLLGVSTRGLQGLHRAAQALALCEGRSFVIPDDVQVVARPVLAHRVVPRQGAAGVDAAGQAVEGVLARVPVPV